MVTIKELKELIKNIPDHFNVSGYEDKGGSWIIIKDPNKDFGDVSEGSYYEFNINEE